MILDILIIYNILYILYIVYIYIYSIYCYRRTKLIYISPSKMQDGKIPETGITEAPHLNLENLNPEDIFIIRR